MGATCGIADDVARRQPRPHERDGVACRILDRRHERIDSSTIAFDAGGLEFFGEDLHTNLAEIAADADHVVGIMPQPVEIAGSGHRTEPGDPLCRTVDEGSQHQGKPVGRQRRLQPVEARAVAHGDVLDGIGRQQCFDRFGPPAVASIQRATICSSRGASIGLEI